MDVTLHVGAHRAATTSFQFYLDRNRKGLQASGLEVWGPKRVRSGLFAGLLTQSPTALSRQRAKRSLGRIEIEQTLLEAAGRRRLLITDENLLGGMRANMRGHCLYAGLAARLGPLADRLAMRLSRVGLFIRSYDRYWASVIGHQVVRGCPVPSEAELDLFVTQPRRWRHVIADLAGLFPGVPLHIFHFERYAGRPEQVLPILAPEIGEAPRTNSRIWHNKGCTMAKFREVLTDRGLTDSATPLGNPDQRWHPFGDLQSRILADQYLEDLEWLRSGADGLAILEEGRSETKTQPARRSAKRQRPVGRPRPDGRKSAIA